MDWATLGRRRSLRSRRERRRSSRARFTASYATTLPLSWGRSVVAHSPTRRRRHWRRGEEVCALCMLPLGHSPPGRPRSVWYNGLARTRGRQAVEGVLARALFVLPLLLLTVVMWNRQSAIIGWLRSFWLIPHLFVTVEGICLVLWECSQLRGCGGIGAVLRRDSVQRCGFGEEGGERGGGCVWFVFVSRH